MRFQSIDAYDKILVQMRGHVGNRPYGHEFMLADCLTETIGQFKGSMPSIILPSLNTTPHPFNGVICQWFFGGMLRFENDHSPKVFFGRVSPNIYTGHVSSHFLKITDDATYYWIRTENDVQRKVFMAAKKVQEVM
jgi:hypothetical protein